MKTIKKLLLPILILCVLVFALVGCDENDKAAKIQAQLDAANAQLTQKTEQLDAVTSQLDDAQEQISATEESLEQIQKQLDEIASKEEPDDYGYAYFQLLKYLAENPDSAEIQANGLAKDYAAECYEKLIYIDNVLSERDCFKGENFKLTQKWITWNLMQAGYAESDVKYQDFTVTRYVKKDADLKKSFSAAKSYTTDGKTYNREDRKYVEAEGDSGAYVKVNVVTSNLVVKKQGKTDKQIIVGAHYDGDGTGDNGSGISLGLTTAQKLHDIETQYTIVFVFFSAEEYGCYGSEAYANAMTEQEVANTLYMINMDSLVCGDYTYLYGGVQNDDTQTVTETEAFDNAMAVAESLGLEFKKNPWTYAKPEPKHDTPDYASPSTGDWSDHAAFADKGIKYLYFEATNWEIPDYSGYGESYLMGMLMNTSKDYLKYIETYYPGRPLQHFKQFSTLLNALLTQSDVNF